MGAILFAGCLATYLSSGQSQPGNDATSNMHQALQLIDHGSLYFNPNDNPKMFILAVGQGDQKRTSRIVDWNMTYQGQPAGDAFAEGVIRVDDPLYYLVPTRHPGKYANTFGLGAGLFALPFVGSVRAVVSDLGNRLPLLWWLGKLAAATSVAGAVLFLYLAALRRLSSRSALLLALAYGLGTCAFAISSQALWQHGPCELFLAMGGYFLLAHGEPASGENEGKPLRVFDGNAWLSGLGFALAVSCRPTSALVAICVAVHFLISDRRRLLWFALGGLPVAVSLLAYSQYTFGSPFAFGQLGAGAIVAQAKTGRPDLWQTPLWLGLAGLLVSPARGLFIFSPLAAFAVWGAVRAFREPAWKDLRPLVVAALLLLGLASKWFDWWGGWCFGYRPIVDLAILLVFLSFPVVRAVAASRALKAAFAGLLAYSIGVQVIGAFAYDVAGWNGRTGWEVVQPGTPERLLFKEAVLAHRFVREHGGRVETKVLDVDRPEFRGRLWSFTDAPLVYYVENFSKARTAREKATADFFVDDG
jgi:hypothetical protein